MKLSHVVALRLLAKLSPRVYGYLRKGPAGAVARRVLDVVAPAGADEVSEVRGGPLKGAKMRLDPRKQKEMLLGSYESGVQEALQKHAGKGDVVFDVGAHVGFFSLLASKVVGEGGRVVACEPDPYMSERLRTNLKLNARGNVSWENVAVGETSSRKSFASGGGAGTGSLSEDGSIEVEVVTLDRLAEKWGAPAVVKVDVEGGELDVLAGGSRVLREHRPVLIVEAHGAENEKAAVHMLENLHYRIDHINDLSGRSHLLATASE
jgi:FkbM family methyltransferase